MVDVVTGKFGSSTPSPTQNNITQAQNQVTPQQQLQQQQQQQQQQSTIKPKHGRQWVLGDSAGVWRVRCCKDFFQIVNSLQDGDTIQVKAGTYNGPIALAKSVSITGETDPKTGARPSIHYSGGTGCAVTAGQVIFETLDFSETSEGSSVLISARSQSVVQIKNCNFVSRGSDCVVTWESAQMVLEDCSFRTLGKGYGCYIKGNAKATINRCSFEENRGCVGCGEAGSVQINDSKFDNNTNDSKDSYSVWLESTGTAELNRCTFTENTIPIVAARGAMALSNCRIEKIHGGFYHFVLAAAGTNTSVTLTNCEFVANEHAVLANQGARLSIEGCKFQQCGRVPTGNLAANDANVLVDQPNTQATITNTTFSDVQFAGVLVADQATASLKDTTIQGGQYGVDLGVTEPNLPKGGFAQLENVTLKGQIGQAVRVTHASYAKLFNCHIDGDALGIARFMLADQAWKWPVVKSKGGKGTV